MSASDARPTAGETLALPAQTNTSASSVLATVFGTRARGRRKSCHCSATSPARTAKATQAHVTALSTGGIDSFPSGHAQNNAD